MKLSICKRLIKVFATTLISLITLYGLSSLPAYAGSYDWLGMGENPEKFCMADAYLLEPGNKLSQDALNCTANDVEITRVTPNDPSAECNLGDVFTFSADVTVRTNANERWDTTFYLPLTDESPQIVHGPGLRDCSIILPMPGDSGETADVELDGDACGDITKALGPDEYTLTGESITMLCADEDGDNRADFTYCAAWDNIERDNCSTDEDPYAGQIPNNKSKCNCDTFNIDVFIKPTPPIVFKTLTSASSLPESGGVFDYTVNFTNTNTQTSLFITSLYDKVDNGANGTYGEAVDESLNLWGATTTVTPATPDGVYLTETNCSQPANGGEILPSGTYSCAFSVEIVDRDLPNDQSPEFYDDLVILAIEDKNGDPVTDGDTCSAILTSVAGDHCTNETTVQVTNLPPAISVTKTPNPTFVLEPSGNVTFTVIVTNEALSGDDWDDPLTLSSLTDSDFDLSTECADAVGYTLAPQGTYTCSFTQLISGDFGTPPYHSNTVTAVATDNENDTDTATAFATVDILNAVPTVQLIKTAGTAADGDTYHVPETGDTGTPVNVDYTFNFSVLPSSVDNVIFNKLDDMVGITLTDLTGDCDITEDSDGPVASVPLSGGYELAPGEYAVCVITLPLLGNAGDTRANTATIWGNDVDNPTSDPVFDSDPALVEFDNVPLQITPQVAMKARVFVRIPNGGIEDVTLTSLRIFNEPFAADTDYPPTGPALFRILNETGGTFGPYVEDLIILDPAEGSSYEFCTVDTVISVGEVYECGFTIKLYPGFATGVTDINAVINGINGLYIKLEDDDVGSTPEEHTVELMFGSQEP